MEGFNNDRIPSYEESLQQGAKSTSTLEHSKIKPLPLPGQLSAVRAHRINAIIETYISPLLNSQLSSGLSKTTLVLVPSNVAALQPLSSSTDQERNGFDDGSSAGYSNQEDVVIGFPSSQYIKLVRLHGGEAYTLEFWRQPAVLAELDSTLKAWLEKSGFRLHIAKPTSLPPSSKSAGEVVVPSPTTTSSQASSPKTKRGFFSRNSRKPQSGQTTAHGHAEEKTDTPASASASAVSPPPPPPPTSSWSVVHEEALERDHVRVKVGLQDVCLRIVTDMGLYETRTGKAVVVDIEIGG